MWIYLLIKVNIQHNEDFMNIIFLCGLKNHGNFIFFQEQMAKFLNGKDISASGELS